MKIFLTIAAIMSLVIVSIAIAVLDEEGVGASVTVNEFISITLIDAGNPGVNFADSNPGTLDVGDVAQTNVVPAIEVSNDAISNVIAKLFLKGTDFTGPAALAVTEVEYAKDDAKSINATTLTDTYPGSQFGNIAPSGSEKIWFFLDLPTGQAAGSYSSTFSFKGTS